MNRILPLLVFTCTFTFIADAQPIEKIAADKLREDVKILRTTLEETHPDLYRYITKKAFDKKADSISASIDSAITLPAFYKSIAPLVASIKNGHTAIKPPASFTTAGKMLPFRLLAFNKDVYIRDDFSAGDEKLNGFQLLVINGLSIQNIADQIMPYVSQDGLNDHARFKAAIEDDLAWYYYMVIGQYETFELVLYDHKKKTGMLKTVSGIPHAEFTTKYAKTNPSPWTLTKANAQTAVLKIGSFENTLDKDGQKMSFNSFVQKSFDQLALWNVKNLVIDIRDNGGGELKNAIQLYSYIASEAFTFTKEIEIASAKPPTYLKYTDYDKSMKLDQLDPGKVTTRGDRRFLTEHFSMESTKPNAKAFKGNLIVMTNTQTGSAAGCFAIQVRRNKRGLIVGEENRDNYTGYSAGVPLTLTLPNSGIVVYIPLRKFVYAEGEATGRGVIPDHVFSGKAEDYFNGKDSGVGYVMELLGKH